MSTIATPITNRTLTQNILMVALMPIIATMFMSAIFGVPVVPIYLIILVAAILDIYLGPTRVTRFFLRMLYIILIMSIVWMSSGSWAKKNLSGMFPMVSITLPRTISWADLTMAAKMDPAVLEAKGMLLLKQRDDEKKIVPQIKIKLQNGDKEGAIALIRNSEWEHSRVEAVVAPPSKAPHEDKFTNAMVYGNGAREQFTVRKYDMIGPIMLRGAGKYSLTPSHKGLRLLLSSGEFVDFNDTARWPKENTIFWLDNQSGEDMSVTLEIT